MSAWVKFDLEGEDKGGANSSLPGGKFLGVGKHEVRISAIEPAVTKDGNPYVKITYINDDGQTFMNPLFPISGQGDNRKQSFKYTSLAHALVPEDGVTRFKFFTSRQGFLPSTPEAWVELIGLRVGIEVVPGKRGYSIEQEGEAYRLFDVEAKEFYTLAGGIPNEFPGFKEAREAAQGQGLYRAWNELDKFYPLPDRAEENTKVLKEVLDNNPQDTI